MHAETRRRYIAELVRTGALAPADDVVMCEACRGVGFTREQRPEDDCGECAGYGTQEVQRGE